MKSKGKANFYHLYLFSQINFMVLRIVTGEYLQMQYLKMNANSVFSTNNSKKVISAINYRQNPVITELSGGAHTTSAPTAPPASNRPRFSSSSINSFILIRTSETLCSASNVWKSAKDRVICGITIFVFGFLSSSG